MDDWLRQLYIVFAEAFEDRESYQGAVPSDDYLSSLISREPAVKLYESLGVREDVLHFDIAP